MASLWEQPSLEFGVKVVRVAGLERADQRPRLEGGGGTLFVRYYVPAGDGRSRLRVDTREVPCGCGGDAVWGEHARFERWGHGAAGAPSAGGEAWSAAAAAAPGAGIVFELRWRPRPSSSGLAALLGGGKRRRPPSRVLARAELAWRDVGAGGAATSAERWLALSPACRELGECKAPKLLVEVNIIHLHHHAVAAAGDDEVTERMSECCSRRECCGQCGWVGSEEDMFLAATFSQQQEAFL